MDLLSKQRGVRLEKLRTNQNISQLELATMLGYKSDSTISKWENGASIPTGKKLVALAQALNTSTDYILFGVDDFSKTETLNISTDDNQDFQKQLLSKLDRIIELLEGK